MIPCIDFIDCNSLNSLRKEDLCSRKNLTDKYLCSSDLQYSIVKFLSRDDLPQVQLNDKTNKIILQNPCILIKIASHFDIRNLNVIISKQLEQLEDSMTHCDEIITGNIEISIYTIEGDENDYKYLRKNLFSILSRETRCYVILCGTACSSLIMSLGHVLGFSSGIYTWLTTEPPVLRGEMNYPKKWIAISLTNTKLNDVENLEENFCYKTDLITSENEHLVFPWGSECSANVLTNKLIGLQTISS